MIYDHFNSFIANVSDQTTLVALDLGEKTIGVAISDLNWLVATPLYTVIRRKFTLDSNKVLALSKVMNVLSLPIYPDLPVDNVLNICNMISDFYKKNL